MNIIPNFINKVITVVLLIVFSLSSIVPLAYAQAAAELPSPGSMVRVSDTFMPSRIVGVKVFAEDPFRFDFILDRGDAGFLQGSSREKEEAARLIKYFLASLAVPEKDIWVNLSPYEKDRIIDDQFGLTEMGRNLLGQDYILKQLTATLIYPEDTLGKEFWKRIYAKAYERYGTTDIPAETFHKVWIVPDSARIYEDAATNTAIIVESRLKVMSEEDYLARDSRKTEGPADEMKDLGQMSTDILRELILPEIEREVNVGRNFAPLRQAYHSLVLAVWYKKRLKDSVLARGFADKKKTAGIDVSDPAAKEKIYEQYLEAYRRGVYNYIKEDIDEYSGEMIPRKYFSGGFDGAQVGRVMSSDGTRNQAQKALEEDDTVVASVKLGVVRRFLDKSLSFVRFRGMRLTLAAAFFLFGVSGCALSKYSKSEYYSPSAVEQVQPGGLIYGHRDQPIRNMGDVYRPVLDRLDGFIREKSSEDYFPLVSLRADMVSQTSLPLADVRLRVEGLGGVLNEDQIRQLLGDLDSLRGLHFVNGEENADRPILVLVHGARGSMSIWEAVIDSEEYRSRYRLAVYIYDYFSPKASAIDLGKIVKTLKGREPDNILFLMGHSLGGEIIDYGVPLDMRDNVRIVHLGFLPQGSRLASGLYYFPFAKTFLSLVPRVKELSLFQVYDSEIQNFLAKTREDPRYWKTTYVFAPSSTKNDRHLTDGALDYIRKLRAAGHAELLDFQGDQDGHSILPKVPDALNGAGKRFLNWQREWEMGRASGASSPKKDGNLQTSQLRIDNNGDNDDTMANPYGGIDLEKVDVSVNRKGNGVTTAFDQGQVLEMLDKAVGLEIRTLNIHPLTPQSVPDFLGSQRTPDSFPQV